MRLISAFLALSILGAFVLAACGSEDDNGGNIADRTINVVATTGMIADAAAVVGGERVKVTGLMGPGVDAHLYKASASDVNALDDADIIFYNGLELEGRMTDIFVRLARSKPTVPVAADIPQDRLREPPEFAGKYDPHVWFDVSLWIYAVRAIEASLSELDPGSADLYKANAEAYIAELEQLDAWVASEIATIPEGSRVLITAHDAFGYFGERYGMEVRGLQGTSTATEAGAGDVQALSDFIAERKIKAIFVESSVPQATIEAVQAAVRAKGHDVAIGGQLFSDAMGQAGTPEGTYLGMVRHNVNTIVQALR
ncbi:MAG: manganese transporter [Chloroflexi bacterium]|nr:MAG: manganese transporter [Chloroflexota bacterium]